MAWPDLEELRNAAVKRGAWVVVISLLVAELIKELFLHRILGWLNERIDAEASPVIHFFYNALKLIDNHRFISFLALVVLYCLTVVIIAQVKTYEHLRARALSGQPGYTPRVAGGHTDALQQPGPELVIEYEYEQQAMANTFKEKQTGRSTDDTKRILQSGLQRHPSPTGDQG